MGIIQESQRTVIDAHAGGRLNDQMNVIGEQADSVYHKAVPFSDRHHVLEELWRNRLVKDCGAGFRHEYEMVIQHANGVRKLKGRRLERRVAIL